jgi:hypothetical protein
VNTVTLVRLEANVREVAHPGVLKAMLYVHRSYVVQALLDNPTNPLNTPYAPSVLAANRSSSLLIQSLSQQFQKCPDICSRVTYIWSHGFSAAMVAGSIVERSPSAVMAVGALADLNMAVQMFQQGAERGSLRAIKTLVSTRCAILIALNDL